VNVPRGMNNSEQFSVKNVKCQVKVRDAQLMMMMMMMMMNE